MNFDEKVTLVFTQWSRANPTHFDESDEAEIADLLTRLLRDVPADVPRVESGPLQFGDDWPGVFIRGDTAFGYATAIGLVIDDVLDGLEPKPMFAISLLSALRDFLLSCDIRTKPVCAEAVCLSHPKNEEITG